jgi:hypothetical protein
MILILVICPTSRLLLIVKANLWFHLAFSLLRSYGIDDPGVNRCIVQLENLSFKTFGGTDRNSQGLYDANELWTLMDWSKESALQMDNNLGEFFFSDSIGANDFWNRAYNSASSLPACRREFADGNSTSFMTASILVAAAASIFLTNRIAPTLKPSQLCCSIHSG